MVSIQFGVAVFTFCLIVKKVFIMPSSDKVQVVQSAAINTNGVNMMTDVGGSCFTVPNSHVVFYWGYACY